MIGERFGPLDVTGAEGDVAVASDINGGVSGAVEFDRGGGGEIDERAGVVGRGDGGGTGGGVGGESGGGFAGDGIEAGGTVGSEGKGLERYIIVRGVEEFGEVVGLTDIEVGFAGVGASGSEISENDVFGEDGDGERIGGGV